MSSLKMTFSLTSLIFLIALGLVFVPTAVMADKGHDSFTMDDDHTHKTAPTVESIMLVNVKTTDATPVSTVRGTSVVPVTDVDGTNIVTTDGREFLVKIQFSEVVYATRDRGAFSNTTDSAATPPTVDVLGKFMINALATASDSDMNLYAATAGDNIISADITVHADTDAPGTANIDESDRTALYVTFIVGATGDTILADLPIDIWITVDKDAAFNPTGVDSSSGNTNYGAGNTKSSTQKFTIVSALPDPGAKPPMVTVTASEELDSNGNVEFTITAAMGEGGAALTGDAGISSREIEVDNGDIVLNGFTGNITDGYMLVVSPDDATKPVTVTVMAGAVADTTGLTSAEASGSYTPEGYTAPVPTVTISATNGTGNKVGKVIFTLDFSEAPEALSVSDLQVTGAELLKIADLVMADTPSSGAEATYMLTVTPVADAETVTLTIRAGAIMAGGKEVDSATKTHTISDDFVATTPETPATTTQIGSKEYLVVVPPTRDEKALPTGVTVSEDPAKDASGDNKFPDLNAFFSTGGTIDVTAKGKSNHAVIITEIMVATDLGKRGDTGMNRPEAGQWIELYNNTDAHINISDIKITFKTGFPAAAAPTDATDRLSNVVSGAGWGLVATFPGAVSGQTSTDADDRTTVTKMFKSLRRKYKDDKTLQDLTAADQVLDGWLSGSWALTADSRVFLAGRIGTPGSENRPTVFRPAAFKAPTMSVTFNEIANLSDDSNEWIELKGAADYNLKNHTIHIVTGYDKATNTGTQTEIYKFPDADVKIPAGGILLLTDKSPTENKLEADLEDGVEKPVRYRIGEIKPLPDDGNFLLVLRTKADGDILDVAGHLAGLDDDDPYTRMWPLAGNVGAAKPGHISAKNKLASGNVYKRHRAIHGYLSVKDNGDEPAYELSGFTGIGYDRVVSPANKEHHGTPGYPNNVQIANGTAAMDHVFISEVMYGDGTHTLPQWIEIQNRSDTNGVDLHNWKLYVVNHGMNADGSAFEGKVVDSFFLRNMKIPPRQTALVVSKAGQNRTNLPPHRVLNLKRKAKDPLLSSKGFYLFLVANAHEGDLAKRQAGDTAGNLPTPKETVTGDNIKLFDDAISTLRAFDGKDTEWDLPAGMNANDYRVSIARRGSDKILNPDGTGKWHWLSSEDDKRSYNLGTSYGRLTDIGTPGNTPGAPLPVSLSKFRPERMKDTGEIVVRWVTESELNNAGFNILRSDKRDGEYTKINTSLIAGQGTTSERTVYEWKDKSAKPNVVYYYQIQDISLDGKVTTLRQSRLKGNVTAAGKLTTTWGGLKALQ